MKPRRAVNCITPPYILEKLLTNSDREIREAALNTLLATTSLQTERRLFSEMSFRAAATGTERRTIYDCRNRRLFDQAVLVRDEGDPETDDASVNLAYDGLGTTYDFFKEVFNRTSIDDRGMRLDGYVHFGQLYNNAFWNGRQMVFGDGDGRVFIDFTGSLDVIAHELGHGVTEYTSNFEYEMQSGALNESMSDVFGSLVKQWSLDQTADEADWLIGNDIFSPSIDGDALRSLKAPGTAYDDPTIGRDPQPAHMDNFANLPNTEAGDWGGVHINSGIPNHAFYLVATALGEKAWEAPGHIWYDALRSSHSRTAFQEFADRTHQSAGRLYGTASEEQQAVADAWREVGIRIADVPTIAATATPREAMPAGRGRGPLGREMRGHRHVDGRRHAHARRNGAESDSLTALTEKLDEMAKQLKSLTRDVNRLKKAKTP